MKNRCEHIEIQLPEFMSGDLSGDEATVVRNHLNDCADCRAELERERLLRKSLGGLPDVACPMRLTQTLSQLAETSEQGGGQWRGRRPRQRSTWLFSTVGLAAAAVLLVVLLPRHGAPPSAPTQSAEAPTTAIASTPTFTDEEIIAARQDLKWTLALTARLIDRTERNTVADVFGNRLPRALKGSLLKAVAVSQGGQG